MQVGLASLGQLPFEEKGTLIIDPWVGETHQPWLATHIEEGNANFKAIARGPFWYFPSLLRHGS